MTFSELNTLSEEQAFVEFEKCCGAKEWITPMVNGRPYNSMEELLNIADNHWKSCSEEAIYEAFHHHPKIGDISSLSKKFANTKEWAGNEQGKVAEANTEVIKELAQGNSDYESKFGFIFIVCATGKSAQEMLDILKSRLPNDKEKELKIAAEEQNKITKLRLEKLLS